MRSLPRQALSIRSSAPHFPVLSTAAVSLLACLMLAGFCLGKTNKNAKVIVLGFDGMDYALTKELIAAGRMPNFKRLAGSHCVDGGE